MASRAELELRAAAVGVDPADYHNDSKLEQKVIFEEKQSVAQSADTAVGTLTSDATAPSNNDTVTIGGRTYTFKTTLTETKASATLTSDATNPVDGDTVTIGSRVYTFVEALTTADQVLIGAAAADTLDNLKAAVNGDAGEGTTYGTGTEAHADVDATTNTDTTQLFVAKTVGEGGNAIAKAEDSDHLDWDGAGAFFTGGVNATANQVLIGASAAAALDNLKSAINASAGAGTTYSTGTTAHPNVEATTNTDTTQLVEALNPGTAGNEVATTEASTHLSWGAATLEGGLGEVVNVPAASVAAVSGGADV